jgi:hypothetical protein
MSKTRIGIAEATAAEVLFASDRTCCVCRERGKPVQIHHIDDDPANNASPNLAVLCLYCHNNTQLKGGFDRKINAAQVVLFRDDWVGRVRFRRDVADQLAAGSQPASAPEIPPAPEAPRLTPQKRARDESYRAWERRVPLILGYVELLPSIRKDAYRRAQSLWDTGITSEMMQGNYDLVEVLQDILIRLSEFYPERHFGPKGARTYFHELITSRFEWHRSCLEPMGPGMHGTVVGPTVGGCVIGDLEEMIEQMVSALTENEEVFDGGAWRRGWRS